MQSLSFYEGYVSLPICHTSFAALIEIASYLHFPLPSQHRLSVSQLRSHPVEER